MKGESEKQSYRNKNTMKLKVKFQDVVTIIIPVKKNGYILNFKYILY